MSDKMPDRQLEGMMFLSFKKNHNDKLIIYEQGQIVDDSRSEFLLVDLFSWLTADHIYSELKTIDEMKEAKFFIDLDHLECWLKNNRHHYQDLK